MGLMQHYRLPECYGGLNTPLPYERSRIGLDYTLTISRDEFSKAHPIFALEKWLETKRRLKSEPGGF